MNLDLVPAVDPTPIPGPSWLFQVLLVFTFFLHALFMNLTLGGTLLAAITQSRSRDATDASGVLAQRLMGINTYAISLAITTGIAPLLFVQVIYQQYFYSATILIGWVWVLFLAMLMVGYYAVYVYKFKGAPSRGDGGTGWLALAAFLFLGIAMIHVAVNLIHSQPAKWPAIAVNPWSILRDPTYVPRLLHFVLAALGFSALVTAWWATRQVKAGKEVRTNTEIASYAWKWVLWTTVLQVVDGFTLLLLLPRTVMLGLMQSPANAIPLGAAFLLALGLLMMLSRVTNPTQKPALVSGTLGTMALTIAVMAVTRHQVRNLYLEPMRSQYVITTAPQWGNLLLFVLLLLAGVATVGYMVRRVVTSPASGENAA